MKLNPYPVMIAMICLLCLLVGILLERNRQLAEWQRLADPSGKQVDDCVSDWKTTLDEYTVCRQHLDKCVEMLSRGR